MRPTLDDAGRYLILRAARTQNGWLPTPVSDAELREIYDMMRLGPTSANTCPARIVFLRTPEAKARLIPALSPGNVDKTKAAPVTAIIGWDTRFWEMLPKLFPHRPDIRPGPFARMNLAFHRSIFGRHSKRVPAHRVQHFVTLHPSVAGKNVAHRVITDMAHVNAPRGIGEHLQHVGLGLVA